MNNISQNPQNVNNKNKENATFVVKEMLQSSQPTLNSIGKSECYNIPCVEPALNKIKNDQYQIYYCTNREKKKTLRWMLPFLIKGKNANARKIAEEFLDKYGEWDIAIRMSAKQLAELLQVDIKTIHRAMKLLHELKIILKRRGGFKEINLYIINYDVLNNHPQLLMKYSLAQKGHIDPLLKKAKAFCSYNNTHDQNKNEKVEEVKDELPIEPEKYRIEKFSPSKTSKKIMNRCGIFGPASEMEWVNEFILCFKDEHFRGKNGLEDWNHLNTNYLFQWFIRKETMKKANDNRPKNGIKNYKPRYIAASKRKAWHKAKLAKVNESLKPPSDPALILSDVEWDMGLKSLGIIQDKNLPKNKARSVVENEIKAFITPGFRKLNDILTNKKNMI